MTRKEIEQQYTMEDTIITDPGQFEGEPIYVPYFVDFYMNGFWDEEDEDVLIYDITDEDRAQFPELKPFKTIAIWQSDQGFWYHSLE